MIKTQGKIVMLKTMFHFNNTQQYWEASSVWTLKFGFKTDGQMQK